MKVRIKPNCPLETMYVQGQFVTHGWSEIPDMHVQKEWEVWGELHDSAVEVKPAPIPEVVVENHELTKPTKEIEVPKKKKGFHY